MDGTHLRIKDTSHKVGGGRYPTMVRSFCVATSLRDSPLRFATRPGRVPQPGPHRQVPQLPAPGAEKAELGLRRHRWQRVAVEGG